MFFSKQNHSIFFNTVIPVQAGIQMIK